MHNIATVKRPNNYLSKKNQTYHQCGKTTLEILEFAKNYNKWIASKIYPHLFHPILEIGAGSGNITQYISKMHPSLYISEIDTHLLKLLQKKFSNKNLHTIFALDIEKPPTKKYKNFFSSIYSVNVLEHIEDDENALRNMKLYLKKNGYVVILVPAKKLVYSSLDKELGHYRRYEKKELREKIENAGLVVRHIEFFNIVGLLSWYVRDKIDKNGTYLKPYQIKSFEAIVPLLKILESMVPVPTGISLIAIAQKNNSRY